MLDPEIISERIHDSEQNENMVHWLHMYLVGDLDRSKLMQIFDRAYSQEKDINPPWEST
jgi:hypothetical protein